MSQIAVRTFHDIRAALLARRELALLRGVVVCDGCCAENAVENRYCQECGEKLWP